MTTTHEDESLSVLVEEKPVAPVHGPGFLLKQARERAGISVTQAASFLRLSPAVIEKMERDRFEGSSLLAYERGYVRAYARYLKFEEPDVDRLVDQFNQLGLSEQTLVLGPAFSWKKAPIRERHVRWVGYLAFLGSVVLVVMWWQTQNTPPLHPSLEVAAAAPASSPSTATANPAENSVAQAPEAPAASAPANATVAAAPEPAPATPAVSQAEPAAPAAPSTAAPAQAG